jgi:hypothetical protein
MVGGWKSQMMLLLENRLAQHSEQFHQKKAKKDSVSAFVKNVDGAK